MPTISVARPTVEGVRQQLAEIGLEVPDVAVHGTVANLIVLQDHMETLRTLVLDDRGTSVAVYRP